jgi:membrane protein implicated in regulation of membrane protease activity
MERLANLGFSFRQLAKTAAYSPGCVMFVWFADILVNGMAALAVGLVVYLGWLGFQQKRKQRKEQKDRERQRRGHWGYE